MSVTPDPNTIIIVSRTTNEPDCSVCIKKDPKPVCNPRFLRINQPRNTSVEFTCPQPQDIFIVEINREIGIKIIFYHDKLQKHNLCLNVFFFDSLTTRLHRNLLFWRHSPGRVLTFPRFQPYLHLGPESRLNPSLSAGLPRTRDETDFQ